VSRLYYYYYLLFIYHSASCGMMSPHQQPHQHHQGVVSSLPTAAAGAGAYLGGVTLPHAEGSASAGWRQVRSRRRSVDRTLASTQRTMIVNNRFRPSHCDVISEKLHFHLLGEQAYSKLDRVKTMSTCGKLMPFNEILR